MSVLPETRTGRHRPYEDVLAILLGTLLVALGLSFYTRATLATGSTAGLALLLHYATGIGFGILFFVINLPFYILAILRMGWQFALKTLASVGLVSLFSAMIPIWLVIDHLNPLFAAMAGGGMIGLGMLALFRHRASVGGINILALYLQERYGLRAGYVQLAIDGVILVAAMFVLPFDRVMIR